jgi:hypothetical protein
MNSTNNDLTVVAPIMKRIIDCVVNNTIDSTTSYDEDSPFERSLCAAWDVCSVQEYALAIKEQQFHRVLLKVIDTVKYEIST